MNKRTSRAAWLALCTLGAGGCSDSVCDAWAGWDVPGLVEMDTCYTGNLAGKTSASDEQFDALFEGRGYTKGYALGADEYGKLPSFTVWTQRGDKHAYKTYRELESAKDSRRFLIGQIPTPLAEKLGRDRWISLADYEALDKVDETIAAIVEPLRFLTKGLGSGDDVKAVRPASDRAADEPPVDCPEARYAKEKWATERFAWLRVEQGKLAGWAAPRPADAPDTVQGRRARLAGATLLEGAKVVPVVEVRAQIGAKRTSEKTFAAGGTAFTLAMVDVASKKVLCRAKTTATNSRTVNEYALGSDLARNGGLAIEGGFRKMAPALTRGALKKP